MSKRSKYTPDGKFLYRIGSKSVFSAMKKEDVNSVNITYPNNDAGETIGLQIGNYKIANWGSDNLHPNTILKNYIRQYTVLAASIDYKAQLIVGQGLFAGRITGIKDNGAEIVQPVMDNPEITSFLNSRNLNAYLAKAAHNLVAYKNTFPELVLNLAKNKIHSIYEKSALIARWGLVNENNAIDSCYLAPDWSVNDEASIKPLSVLDYENPLLDLQTRAKSLTNVIFLNSMYDIEYYPIPNYETAINSLWVDIALKTPKFLSKGMDNAFNILFHIKIPQEFFDYKFPPSSFKNNQERMDAIDSYMDDLEDNLTTVDNARKAISNISVKGETGEPVYWQIETINAKDNFSKEILASDTADNQLTNTFLINDAVFLKKGTSGYGAGSGSDIREAHLINVSMLKADRDRVLEPLYLIRDFNSWGEDIVFRFRDNILTTLDTGASTQPLIS